MGTEPYDDRFYDRIRESARRSAEHVVPIVHGMALDGMLEQPRVLDVGGGEGWWAHEFARLGADAWVVDHRRPPKSPIDPERFVELDVEADPLPAFTVGAFELVVCLEVAEHLPEQRAAGFVAELCDLAPVVLFSAAIPDQGGDGHVNCRWPAWWAAHFRARGFLVFDYLRWLIWDEPAVAPWYRQNVMLAVHRERRGDLCRSQEPGTTRGGTSGPAAVVHPDLWMPAGAPGLNGGGPGPRPRGRRR